jgi:hypothetical protein
MPWISASSPLSSASRRPPAADGDHRTTTSFIFPSRHDRTKLFQQSIHLRTWVLLIYFLSLTWITRFRSSGCKQVT